VILGGTSQGKNTLPNTYGGPKAKDCLTKVQKELVEHVATSGVKAKILAIHAPPIGPWGYWKDDELSQGRVRYNANDLKAAADELNITGNRPKLVPEPYFQGTDGERRDSLNRL